MRTFNVQTNTDKGKLLVSLFPQSKKEIVEFIEAHSNYIIENAEKIADQWDNGFISFEFWLRIAEDVNSVIKKKRKSIEQSNNVFADQLFYDLRAVFVNDCILKFALERKPETKLAMLIAFLYCIESDYTFHFND